MATLKIVMLGGRRCGKTTILSKIKQHFNEVLHHGADEADKNDLLSLIPPTGEITKLNNAQDCINELFSSVENCYQEFAIDENASNDKTVTTFKLNPLQGKGSLSLEFTDIPGEWCSYVEGYSKENKLNDVKNLIIDSNVIIIAIDTPSLMELNGINADYYNRIRDIKELFASAFSGETFSKNESQKMIIFVPLKCEKYVIKSNGCANVDGLSKVCSVVELYYKEMIDCFKYYQNNITMAILPIVTIKEVEWARFFTLNTATGETGGIYDDNGLPQKFIYGKSNSINLCSKFRFKPELYDAVAEGDKESQSLYCEQPLVYSLVYLFKYYSMYGKKPFWTKIPILGSFFAALFKLFGLFEQNEAYEVESKRLRAKIMLREKNGFKILQNPLGI